MKILAIETSCDETSIAIVECNGSLSGPRFKILKNIVSSQILVHREFGGVVPNLAKREHLKNLPIVLKQILKPKTHNLKPDYIAATVGPGLEPALWTGINFAKELSVKLKKPLLGVNHLEGHIYSILLPIENSKHKARNSKQYLNSNVKNSKRFGFRYSNFEFPAILLLVSGGHTILLNMKSITKWTKLGETLDDAAGEAFDKVARLLGLPYPGGPEIERLALSLPKGQKPSIQFPRPMLNKSNYEFSFSGLKTAVLYYLRDHPIKNLSAKSALSLRESAAATDIAAAFQQAVIDVLVKKTIRAAEEYKAKSVLLCGGVAANKLLRETLCQTSNLEHRTFVVPDYEYNTDNAAMIAAAAYINLLQKNKERLKLEAQGNLSI